MSFSDEIAKRRTNRATLVRLNPGRYIVDQLAADGGGVYSLSFDYPVSAIKRNGTALTEVSINPPTVNDTYYSDESTSTLKIKLAAAPSTSNVIIAYYYLFYTSAIETVHYETPTDSATQKRFWQPRLTSDSNFSSGIDGFEAGVVSIADASIEINNADADFSNYISSDDSFFNKTIDIWHCVNGQYRKAYSGTITGIDSVSLDYVVISFSDQLSLLSKTAYFGDDYDECFHVSVDVPKKDLFKPIPLVFGPRSWQEQITYTSTPANQTIGVGGLSAVCIDYSATIATNTNRNWTAGRTTGGAGQQYFGNITRVVVVSLATYFYFDDYENLFAGDTISWNEGGTDYYQVILSVGDFTYLGNTYNVYAGQNHAVAPVATTSSTMYSLYAMAVYYLDPDNSGSWIRCYQGRDYTPYETATAGGGYILSWAFAANFEAAAFASATLDPGISDVLYVMTASDNTAVSGHAIVLKEILQSAGCTVNAASFTAANAAVSQNVLFTVPFRNESEVSSYLVYAQKILESMLGYLKQNDDGEISYHLLAAPTPTDIRDSDTIMNNIKTSLEYRDIVTDITAKNIHAPTNNLDSQIGGRIESAKARYLHDTQISYVLEHVLAPSATGTIARQSEILALRSSRRAVVQYETETIDLDTIIGDESTVSDDTLNAGTTDLFIKSIRKSEEQTIIEGDDLLGL